MHLPPQGWTVRRFRGKVAELHDIVPDPKAGRQVWLLMPTDTSLVLGSAQLPTVVRQADSQTDTLVVQRRRSGGAAVLLSPTNSLWVDVVITRSDSLWDDDVRKAPMWLGHVWAAALGSLGTVGLEVCASYEAGRWGDLVCFAGRGPGEVLVGEAKAVGISQRRTRSVTRFQCLAYRYWSPEELIVRLAVAPEQVGDLRESLASAVWPTACEPDELHRAFLASLPKKYSS